MTIFHQRFMRFAFLTILLWLLVTYGADAQCPMCRMSAESNLKNGGTAAAGLNKGIIFLLIGPYIMISTVAFLWWQNYRSAKQDEQQDYIMQLLEPHDVVLDDPLVGLYS